MKNDATKFGAGTAVGLGIGIVLYKLIAEGRSPMMGVVVVIIGFAIAGIGYALTRKVGPGEDPPLGS